MDTNQTIVCAKSPNQAHEWAFNEALGEYCKHCGLIRSHLDGIKPAEEKKPELPRIELPDDLLRKIMDATGSKAAIVLTFSEPLVQIPVILQAFHISAANVDMKQMQDILLLLHLALTGKLGGDMNMRGQQIPRHDP